jgi:cyclopropane-fatty-acyl-phospholipid synthase
MVREETAAASRTLGVLEAVFGERYLRDFDIRLWDGSVRPSKTAHRDFVFCLNSPGALRNAFAPPVDLNAGAAFVDGSLEIQGDLCAAVALINAANSERSPLQTARIALLLAQLPRESRPAPPHAHITTTTPSTSTQRFSTATSCIRAHTMTTGSITWTTRSPRS